MVQSPMNNIFHRLLNNIPGLALLIWTLALILVGLDVMASGYLLFPYYPFYSLIFWMIIGAFSTGKVWKTIMSGLVGHVIIVLYLISTAEYELVAILALLAIVFSALLSSVVVLVSSRFANSIRNLWFLWVILNVMGYGTGDLIGGYVYLAFSDFSSSNSFIVNLVAGTVTGLVIGLAQWFVLRQEMQESGWWILASGMGVAIASLLLTMTESITGQMPMGLSISLRSTLYGFVLGFMQWLLLRRQFDRAKIWIIATMIGHAVSSMVPGILITLDPTLSVAAAHILLGAVTGGVLVWLSQNYRLEPFRGSA